MSMQTPNDIIGNPNRNLPPFSALRQPSSLRRHFFKRKINSLYFKQPNMDYVVQGNLPLPQDILSISAGHTQISHTITTHINTIVTSTQFPYKLCLRFRCSGQNFVALFLANLVLDTKKFLGLSSLTVGFPNFPKKNIGYMFKEQNLFDVCPLKRYTHYCLSKLL